MDTICKKWHDNINSVIFINLWLNKNVLIKICRYLNELRRQMRARLATWFEVTSVYNITVNMGLAVIRNRFHIAQKLT